MFIKLWRTALWPFLWLFNSDVEHRTGPKSIVRSGWFWVQTQDKRGHVLPVGDLREHELTTQCWCKPKLKEPIVSHQAQDGRE